MRKLLSANFSRLFHSTIYRLGMLFMFGLAAFAVCCRFYNKMIAPEYAYPTADGLWFMGGMYIGIVFAVFISFWVGTDYSDGTIRNKLLVGHTRMQIYFSNWFVCVVASLMMHLMYIGVVAGLGYALLGKFETPIRALALCTLSSLVTVIAWASLFLLISMLIHNKATCAVVSMVTALVLLFGTIIVLHLLQAPEFFDTNYMLNEAGELVQAESIANPQYLSGTKRAFFEFILDFQPGGQMLQYGMSESLPERLVWFPIYSTLFTVLTTGVGVFFFRRKDLK